MATLLIVWLCVHIALVTTVIMLIGWDTVRTDKRALAFICVFPALVLAVTYAFKRYTGGWI